MEQKPGPAVDESRRVVPPGGDHKVGSEIEELNRQAVEDIDILEMLKERLHLITRGGRSINHNPLEVIIPGNRGCGYLYNVGFTLHKQLAEEEARKEATTQ